jgi:hypothetical protein
MFDVSLFRNTVFDQVEQITSEYASFTRHTTGSIIIDLKFLSAVQAQ